LLRISVVLLKALKTLVELDGPTQIGLAAELVSSHLNHKHDRY
jgi:hypothetical protein